MSSRALPLAICLAAGVLATCTGCPSLGPQMGILAYPIPISPYWMKKQEDKFHIHEKYGRLPILGPIPPGGPTEAIDPPSDDEVMRALEEIDPVQGGLPLMHEMQRNDVLIHKEKIADFIDPPRFYPVVGPAQLHHSRWKCTVYYTRVIRPGWPLPQHMVDNSSEVVYIDHDHLHRIGDPNESLGRGPLLATPGDHPVVPVPPPAAVPVPAVPAAPATPPAGASASK